MVWSDFISRTVDWSRRSGFNETRRGYLVSIFIIEQERLGLDFELFKNLKGFGLAEAKDRNGH